MLGSVGFGELLLIAIIALVVFGPHRLPEIARKAGQLMAQARRATQELTDALDAEYDGAASPIRDLQSEYEATKRHFTDTATKVTGSMMSSPSTPDTVPPEPGSPPVHEGGEEGEPVVDHVVTGGGDEDAPDPEDPQDLRGSGTP
jgi:sec-independent protein translocase protein TatB